MVAGVFDGPEGNCPHKGHVHLLKTAKEICDYLIVCVNSDDYIINKKNRSPLTTQSKRIEALYNTGLVDECVPFESDPLPIILFLKPDTIIVGSDYSEDKVVGWPKAREWGGNLFIVNRIGDYSTSNVIKQLNKK